MQDINALIISISNTALKAKRTAPQLELYQVSVPHVETIAQNIHYFCTKVASLCNAQVTLTFVGDANHTQGYSLQLKFY